MPNRGGCVMPNRGGATGHRAAASLTVAVAAVLLASGLSPRCQAQPAAPASRGSGDTSSAAETSGTADTSSAAETSGTADTSSAAETSGTADASNAADSSGTAGAPAPAASSQATAPPQGPIATTIDQPRPFGYVLGDTLTQRVRLARDFQPEALPPLERAGLWFARRSATIQRADDDHRWLVMEYQLVNAPQTLMTVNLPEVTLKSKAGSALTVPIWPISVAPLTPQAVFAKGGLQELRPDHPAPLLPTSALQRQLQLWLTAFAVTLVAWLAWWLVRSIRAAANQPFARALREIRQSGDDSPDAWLALHRAFDRTASRALQTSTLPALIKRAPHFESQRAAIERFYDQSNLRFFGGAPARAQADPSDRGSPAPTRADAGSLSARRAAAQPVALRKLAMDLRRLEKQHER
jgi:mxaA protein